MDASGARRRTNGTGANARSTGVEAEGKAARQDSPGKDGAEQRFEEREEMAERQGFEPWTELLAL